jgi:hypothetical protein
MIGFVWGQRENLEPGSDLENLESSIVFHVSNVIGPQFLEGYYLYIYIIIYILINPCNAYNINQDSGARVLILEGFWVLKLVFEWCRIHIKTVLAQHYSIVVYYPTAGNSLGRAPVGRSDTGVIKG